MCWSESTHHRAGGYNAFSSDLNPLNFARCLFSFLHVGVRGSLRDPLLEAHPPGHPERPSCAPLTGGSQDPLDLEEALLQRLCSPMSVPDPHLRTPAVPASCMQAWHHGEQSCVGDAGYAGTPTAAPLTQAICPEASLAGPEHRVA